MPFPNSAGNSAGSSTFKLPPLDGSLTLVDVLDFNGTKNATHPLFTYEQDGQLRKVLWGQALHAIHTAARFTRSKIGPVADPVAIFATLDAITYYTLIVGILRAGYVPFPISTRNSPAAVANLLQSTGCKHVLVTNDHAIQSILQASRSHLPKDYSLHAIDSPYFGDLYRDNVENDELLPPLADISQESLAVILHSSGSTAFPKPIRISMRVLMENGLAPLYGEIDFPRTIQASHGLPMFHLMGVIQISWTTFAGLTMAVFPPVHPPVIPTSDNVFEAAVSNKCTTVLCVPAFLEAWFKDPLRRKTLKNFDLVMFAGGPLEPSVGDGLVADGVVIAPVTEAGPISMILPKSPPQEGWSYWRLCPHLDPVLIPYDEEEGTWRLILKQCPTHHPSIVNTAVDGIPALDTNDLVVRHPQNPDLLSIYGRSDDQIVHSTGEKTNPVPLEAILSRHHAISSSIMFGTSRFHAGLIVAPTPDKAFDPENAEKLAEYRNLIWSAVEEVNAYAPSHSRIFKEMIIVTHPSKPFEYTPKLTPRRKAVLAAYAKEIDAVYDAVKESSQVHLMSPDVWDASGCFDFASRVIRAVLVNSVGDEEDIFQAGCDSLQATWIRNTILHALNTSTSIDTRQLPQNFVYANPTIRQLGAYLFGLFSNSQTTVDPLKQMEALAAKYSRDFPTHLGTLPPPEVGDVVLITGTSGFLGSQLLASLLARADVSKVYALNRSSLDETLERHKQAFAQRGLDVSHLASDKLVFLQADLPSEHLGVGHQTYETLSQEVTSIIHNAWNVNFNISLKTMEPQLLSTRRLINLALSSKQKVVPRLVFVSSIGVFNRWSSDTQAPEAHLPDPAISVGQGYSESKWCAEKILQEASIATELKPVVVRVGQLCGAASTGSWNPSEWFPSLLRSSQQFRSVPNLPGAVSWVPIDHAAEVINELRKCEHQYINLVHPAPASASTIFRFVASHLNVPLVSWSEWCEILEQSTPSDRNPALKLLSFFRAQNGDDKSATTELFGLASVQHNLALSSSQSFRELQNNPLTEEDVKKWVAFWKRIDFL